MTHHHEVVTALIVREGEVLLGLRSPDRAFWPGVWDMFGGHLEPGEGHAQALVRELQEELGITPTAWRFLETISLPTDEASGTLTMHLYLVGGWSGTPANRQLEEHTSIDWFTLEQAIRLPLAHPAYPMLLARYLPAGPAP